MAEAVNTITTRQKAEELVHSDVPLAGAGQIASKVSLVAGYAAISILSISDQPFSITIDEACDADGEFTRTVTLASVVDAAGNQHICERVAPCGNYAIITLVNGGGQQTLLSFCALGIPA